MIGISSVTQACARGRYVGPAERAAIISRYEGEVARLEVSAMIVRPRSFHETTLTEAKLRIAKRELQMSREADDQLRREGR